jgi:hypothetical protein
VYSDEPEAHQAITRSRKSHARTIGKPQAPCRERHRDPCRSDSD